MLMGAKKPPRRVAGLLVAYSLHCTRAVPVFGSICFRP